MESLQSILSLIDLTRLNEDDTEKTITELCRKSITPFGTVASVCCYPKFIPIAKKLLSQSPVKITTVVNFPSGQQSLQCVLSDTQKAIYNGVNEIDLLIPYQSYQNNSGNCKSYVEACKKICGSSILLKVILETGELSTPTLIAQAARDAINAGANFVKTSSGKTAVGATPQAVCLLMNLLKEEFPGIGLKISGGIRTVAQVNLYLNLIEKTLGESFISPETLRFGASQLLDEILNTLKEEKL